MRNYLQEKLLTIFISIFSSPILFAHNKIISRLIIDDGNLHAGNNVSVKNANVFVITDEDGKLFIKALSYIVMFFIPTINFEKLNKRIFLKK